MPNPPLQYGQFYFKTLRHLGSGGLGSVSEIEVTESWAPESPVGTRLAKKCLNDNFKSNDVACARFEREIGAVRQMEHGQIVKYRGENLAGGNERFYLMPIYQESIRKMVKAGLKKGDWKFAAEVGTGLALALAYAHDMGIIHRDLKPENLLYVPGGKVIIVDWGCGYFVHKYSKLLQPALTVWGPMGTEYYCSLEQWNSGKCDETGDIYSLGMTLDEIARGGMRTTLTQGYGIHPKLIDTVAASTQGAIYFNAVLRKMTSAVASQRYQSMAEVAADLRYAVALDSPAMLHYGTY
jgi:serine/threonine-protein kinase